MSSDDLADFWVHTVTVHTYQGTNGDGSKSYTPPLNEPGTSVPCFLERKQLFIRAADGSQVVSQASVFASVDWVDTLTPQSLVTTPDGVLSTTVMQRDVNTGGDFIDGIDHVQAFLQ